MAIHLDHLSLVLRIQDIELQLESTQRTIDAAREEHPTNGEFQLEMDRSQSELDRKQRMIAFIKHDIPSRN